MIRSRDVNKEVKILDDMVRAKDGDNIGMLKGILKGITLLVKLVRDVRTNQVIDLESRGIKLLKEDRKDAKTETK